MTELEPHADLKAALTAARNARIAQQWECEAMGASAAFFFCTRAGVRYLVSIEARCPPDREATVRISLQIRPPSEANLKRCRRCSTGGQREKARGRLRVRR